jgi:hypothetical protein
MDSHKFLDGIADYWNDHSPLEIVTAIYPGADSQYLFDRSRVAEYGFCALWATLEEAERLAFISRVVLHDEVSR